MPANFQPLFTISPVISQVYITGASTTRDASGPNVFPVVSGNNFGTRIELLTIIATGTTTNGMVRLYLTNPYQGSLKTGLWQEVSITATTPSSTVKTFTSEITRTDGRPLILLNSGASIKASTHNNEGFVITAQGGDF